MDPEAHEDCDDPPSGCGPRLRAGALRPGRPHRPWPAGEPLGDTPCSQLTDEQMNAAFERYAAWMRQEA